jgi:hypothetical protein
MRRIYNFFIKNINIYNVEYEIYTVLLNKFDFAGTY